MVTSEVVILNKEAVVIAADSAVTVGRDPHPRYSKSANKIFDASAHGNLAVAIFSGAEIDGVPWELAVKQFRAADAGNAARNTVAEYIPALMTFLQGNALMFPVQWRDERLKTKIAVAALSVVDELKSRQAAIDDDQMSGADTRAAWDAAHATVRPILTALPLATGLSQANYDAVHALRPQLAPEVHQILKPHLAAVLTPDEIFELAVEYAFRLPQHIYNSTGVVFAGYGADQIFPAFHSITVYGLIGSEIFYVHGDAQVIDHASGAWIQPFAKFSMIQRFTDGFDFKQQELLQQAIQTAFTGYNAHLVGQGMQLPPGLDAIVEQLQNTAVQNWKTENWKENFHPLRRVLNSLSVQEMAELAETLLVLESLRERVTSPSESVGGPVDVAAITKTDGLVWIRRKHYFDSQLNLRYLQRVKPT
jgi:hypothetical protein